MNFISLGHTLSLGCLYKSHRSILFKILQVIKLLSTSKDKAFNSRLNIVGIDLSKELIKLAKNNVSNGEFYVHDINYNWSMVFYSSWFCNRDSYIQGN